MIREAIVMLPGDLFNRDLLIRSLAYRLQELTHAKGSTETRRFRHRV